LLRISADEKIREGLQFQGQGHINEAISCFQEAIQLNPKLPAAYYALGSLLQQQGGTERAMALYKKILELSPYHSDTYNILGSAFQEKGQIDDAIASYQKAIQFNPNSFLAHNNLGTALKLHGKIDEAINNFQKALELNPGFSEALNNLGNAFRDQGKLDESILCYRKAIQINPQFADAHWNLAFALLLAGRFEEGWKEYEWRWKLKEPKHKLSQPLWDGSDITGRSVLLYAEQGLGDVIQFARYASMVADRGAHVIIGCQKELKSLLRGVNGVSDIRAFGDPLPHFDLCCPIMSLPGIFKTFLDTIPSNIPYIQVDALVEKKWRDKLSKDHSKLNVGLAWAGSQGHLNDRNRSCLPDLFLPLARIKDVKLFSVQKDISEKWSDDSLKDLNMIDYTKEVEDFTDTAGIIMNLDLVISVDTAVVHLAGALGKPVWTLLPYAPDWRWMLDREDSPWYPRMRLFRQPSPGDWKSVIDHVTQELILQVRQ
jgi:tetratricopeptide (TPR) repeat protein